MVLDGPLDKERFVEEENVDVITTDQDNLDVMDPKMNWIAAEEVCTSSQVNAKDENVSLKGECNSDEHVFQGGKTSKAVKVYKRQFPARQTLRNLKMQLAAA